MPSASTSRAGKRRCCARLLALAAALALGACVGPQPGPAAPAPANRQLVIVQSDDSPAFAGVARAIAARWKDGATVLRPRGNGIESELARALAPDDKRVIVAVGLPAAQAARKHRGARVIFCQVFNYEDFELLAPWMKGVGATPPTAQLFQVWKKLDPRLKRVGVVTGPRLQTLVAEARAAAAVHGIEIVHTSVRSDLETLYAFKQMAATVQGLWLVPDNRVLSRNALRDLLTHSRKQGKQVTVFSEQLLSHGGMMSYDSTTTDIAEQVLVRVEQTLAANGTEVPGPSMLPLTRIDIKINPLALRQLGLTLPPELKGLTHAP